MTYKKLITSNAETSVVEYIGNNCNSCDIFFDSEEEFKDHILTTLHKGPSEGKRNFKYRMTDKTARANLLKGAVKEHFSINHKQGATNVDFNDGTWLLVAFPQILKWKKDEHASTRNDITIEVVDIKEGKDLSGRNMDPRRLSLALMDRKLYSTGIIQNKDLQSRERIMKILW